MYCTKRDRRVGVPPGGGGRLARSWPKIAGVGRRLPKMGEEHHRGSKPGRIRRHKALMELLACGKTQEQ